MPDVDGRPLGMTQRYLLADDTEWSASLAGIINATDAAGIDYLLGEPDAVGRGLGTEVIAELARSVFAWRPVASVVVTVQQANIASWRVLEKVGFHRVWSGRLASPDPSDAGPGHVYVLARPIG